MKTIKAIDKRIADLEREKARVERIIAIEAIRGRVVSLASLLKFKAKVNKRYNDYFNAVVQINSYGGPSDDSLEKLKMAEMQWVLNSLEKIIKAARLPKKEKI